MRKLYLDKMKVLSDLENSSCEGIGVWLFCFCMIFLGLWDSVRYKINISRIIKLISKF